ncbi:hypothetical protein RFI_08807 [Reticulomyxa filosa]|uniref:Uncharacterized protein n=1 Tax=Reticulomyxa filosa TaxID=46433 RepID=X6NPV2_RETFI|nr:hypothetical protein RFI_08807 [Reticulomyxa filosa]|eukprot:ETO28325.1 hypothetical protein RFI_08807 [Reticulomyxa filosa]
MLLLEKLHLEAKRDTNTRQLNYATSTTNKNEMNINKKENHYRCYEFLSPQWMEMAQKLKELTRIVFENKCEIQQVVVPKKGQYPKDQKNTHSLHSTEESGKREDGTLWDEIDNEPGVRILLEEGKLNLLLRLLSAYKSHQNSKLFFQQIEAFANNQHEQIQLLLDICDKYEKCVGMLLFLCTGHAEVLQILDIDHFVQHIKNVLDKGLKKDKVISKKMDASSQSSKERDRDFFSSDKTQEILVFYYMFRLTQFAEQIDEEKIIQRIAQLEILHPQMPFIAHCCTLSKYLKQHGLFLHILLTDLYIPKLFEKNLSSKKNLRGLLDMFNKAEIAHSKVSDRRKVTFANM